MRKTLLLMRIELRNLFANSNFASGNKKKKAGGLAVFLIPAALMLYISVVYSFSMMTSLPKESRYIMPVILSVMAFVMLVSLSFYSASGHLFGFKDFDLLMSLPVNRNQVMLSKLLAFVMMDYFYAFFLALPYIIIYGINTAQPVFYYLIGILCFLFMPLIPMVFSSVLALLVALFSSGSRYQVLIRNLLSLLMVGLLMFLSFKLQNMMFLDGMGAEALMHNILLYFAPVYFMASALIYQNLGMLLIFIVMSVAIFALFVFFFSKLFTKLNISYDQGYKDRNFRLGRLKTSSRFQAIFRLQVSRYFSSTGYLINTIVGPAMIFIFVIIGLFNGVDMIRFYMQQMEEGGLLLVLLSAMVLFSSSMCAITASSISLEGKYLYILKGAPVDTKEIFKAKILLQVLVSFGFSALGIILGGVIYWLSVKTIAVLLLISLVSSVFFAVLGLVINLSFPKMEWESETLVVKQSMSAMIAIFGGMALVAGHGYLLYLLSDKMSLFGIVAVVVLLDLILSVLLWVYLSSAGVKKFARL